MLGGRTPAFSEFCLQLMPAPARQPATPRARLRLPFSARRRQVLPKASAFRARVSSNHLARSRRRDPASPAGLRIGSPARPRPGRGQTRWASSGGTQKAPQVRQPPALPGARLARLPPARGPKTSRLLPASHLLCVRVVAVPVAALMPFHLHSP